MAIYIFGLAMVLFGAFAFWYLRTETTTGLSVQTLWTGSNGREKVALLLEGGVLVAGVLLLCMRDAPSDLVLPVFWVLFPTMLIALVIAGIVAIAQSRRARRPASVLAGAASVMALIAVLAWMFLPRVLVFFDQVLSGRPM